MAGIDAVQFTCEHGGNGIPREWRILFRGQEALLASHRGWDPGALAMAKRMARGLGAPLNYSTTSRLLVELNRSIGHPDLFSRVTKALPHEARGRILHAHYFPYRERLEAAIAEKIRGFGRGGALLHVSVHTFTPELDGEVRNADVAFLYDPARRGERAFAEVWREAMRQRLPGLRLRMNYPYRGAADAFTTHLRRRFPSSRYLGIELEVNQAITGQPGALRRRVAASLITSLRAVVDSF